MDELQRVAMAAEMAEAGNEGWQVPLELPVGGLPPFPVEVLGDPLGGYVDCLAEATQTPLALPGLASLAAVGMAGAGRYRVECPPGHYEPVNIYVCTVLGSGGRKSAVMKAVARPLVEWERDLQREGLLKLQQEMAHRRSILRRLTAAESKGDIAEINRLAADLLIHPEVFPRRRLADDSTPEALTTLLCRNEAMGVFVSEAGILSLDRYSKGANYEVLLNAWDGGAIRVDREGREPKSTDAAYLTLCLSIQPGAAVAMATDPGKRDRGLPARFLYARPASLMGRRRFRGVQEMPASVRETYHRMIRAIAASPGGTLTLSPDAMEAWYILAEDETEPRLLDDFKAMQDWVGKYPGAVARLAGILHLAEHADKLSRMEIGVETMAKAIEIGRYLVPHARSVLGTPERDAARRVLRWVCKRDSFSERDCFTENRWLVGMDRLRPLLALLDQHHWIRRRPVVRTGGAGRPPSPVYDVNPSAQNPQNQQNGV